VEFPGERRPREAEGCQLLVRRTTALITDWTMPACRRRRTSPLLQGLASRFDLHQLPGVNDHLQFMMMRARLWKQRERATLRRSHVAGL
jgi:hypothetical protein